MIGQVTEFILGLVLAALTLRDVFDTVVVPGGSTGVLSVARRMIFAALPVYKVLRWRLGVGFAPFMLLLTFAVWMCLLTFAFGLMVHSLSAFFAPPLRSFGDALYVAGSALATIGLAKADASGIARGVVLAAAFCGLAVMTMAVTYLLEVQSAISNRDAGILKVTTSAGEPPSGVGLLQSYAMLDCRAELRDILRGGRDWIATVFQTHSTHPSLIYFRSPGTAAGWPATFGAFMDLALILEMLVDDKASTAPAVLLRREGDRMAKGLMVVLDLQPCPADISKADVEAVCARLATEGYRLRAGRDVAAFIEQRQTYARCIAALAEHLGTAVAPLLPRNKDPERFADSTGQETAK